MQTGYQSPTCCRLSRGQGSALSASPSLASNCSHQSLRSACHYLLCSHPALDLYTEPRGWYASLCKSEDQLLYLNATQVAETDEASIMAGEKTEQTRWVVPARSSRQLIVQFQSEDMGSFKDNLVFEV